MNKITAYLRKDYERKDGLYQVYCMVSIRGQKCRFETGVFIAEGDWDVKECVVKNKAKDAQDSNLIIQDTISKINDVFVRYRLMNRVVTPIILEKEFKNPSVYNDFFDFMDKISAVRNEDIEESTIATHTTLKNSIEEYCKHRKIQILFISDINDDFVKDFTKFLRTKKENKTSTINKKLRILRSFVTVAVNKKLIDKIPQMSCGDVEADREFLDPEEVSKLWKEYSTPADIYEDKDHYTLMVFLFSCFTGLRISDLNLVKIENVSAETLLFTPKKTKKTKPKTLRIPLTKPAMMIYEEARKNRSHGLIFKMEADQTMNKRIKKICKTIGIHKHISFHCGRHTFATIFLRKGGKLHILQKLLGHSNISETMKYVHILPDDTVEDMEVFNSFVIDSFSKIAAISYIINWDRLSLLVDGTKTAITQNKISKNHLGQVEELLKLVGDWYEKNYKA